MAARRDKGALFDLPGGRMGRVERAINTAIAAARRDGALIDVDTGALTLARSQARGVDLAEAARDVWALARIGGELRETLIRLRLDPVSRGATRDQLADFLASLTEPSPPTAGNETPMGDAAQS